MRKLHEIPALNRLMPMVIFLSHGGSIVWVLFIKIMGLALLLTLGVTASINRTNQLQENQVKTQMVTEIRGNAWCKKPRGSGEEAKWFAWRNGDSNMPPYPPLAPQSAKVMVTFDPLSQRYLFQPVSHQPLTVDLAAMPGTFYMTFICNDRFKPAQPYLYEQPAVSSSFLPSVKISIGVLLLFLFPTAIGIGLRLHRQRNEGILETWIPCKESPFIPTVMPLAFFFYCFLMLMCVGFLFSALMGGKVSLMGAALCVVYGVVFWAYVQYQCLLVVFFHHELGRYFARFLLFPIGVLGISFPARSLYQRMDAVDMTLFIYMAFVAALSLLVGWGCKKLSYKRIGHRGEGLRRT